MSVRHDELRPCEVCKGPLVPSFVRVRLSVKDIPLDEVRSLAGVNAILGGGGRSLGIAAALHGGFQTETRRSLDLFLCAHCSSTADLQDLVLRLVTPSDDPEDEDS